MEISEKIKRALNAIDNEKESINVSYSLAKDSDDDGKGYFNFEALIAETKIAALEELLDELLSLIKE